jgi:hypothetical protein
MNMFLKQAAIPQATWDNLPPEEVVKRAFNIIRIPQMTIGGFMPLVFGIMAFFGVMRSKGAVPDPSLAVVCAVIFGVIAGAAIGFAAKVSFDARSAIPQISSRTQQVSVLIRSSTLVTALCGTSATFGVVFPTFGVPLLWSVPFFLATPTAIFLLSASRADFSKCLRTPA